MANLDGDDEPEWIKRVKSEGAVPLLDPHNCSNGWASPPGNSFMVRGPEYFLTKVKVHGGEFLLKPLGFDWIKGPKKISGLLNSPTHRIRRALQEENPTGRKPFVWAFNLQVPSKENYSAIAYFVGLQPVPEGSLMEQFLKGDDAIRTRRLKLIANVVKGPWIVRKAVGEQAICVIGRALTCNYCIADDFIEVDIDIGSSVIANAIVHLAFNYLSTLTVDLAFLIESQAQSELPERILGAVRFSELKTTSAQPVEMPSDGNMGELPPSFSSRLWKSFGHSFSHRVQTDTQDGSSNSSSSHVEGAVDSGMSKEDTKK
uniref:Protein ENHANCED DISEASE RESISTANCE 2-like n=1 Tax=Nicotiana tabacum TaxID=4097 RepID=A0A1S3YVX6_TOBAC|nr:PREDICTED: protein ENHANCED DISEASE RESISTANCE 2-like [Nicotiana tabacum]XP_016456466.1 PREDICTED: protein ENHANCED DISEASE RESISTANCE 2-like [Nicotiana tabacum]XP_016456476.1 PREDICTED: protein ENHANCED DISEASE RESISTANCE 2-like [Nicotiana tabacum]